MPLESTDQLLTLGKSFPILRKKVLLVGNPVLNPDSLREISLNLDVEHVTTEIFYERKRFFLEQFNYIWLHIETRLESLDIASLSDNHIVVSTTTGNTHIAKPVLEYLGSNFISLKTEVDLLNSITSTAEHALCLLLVGVTKVNVAIKSVAEGTWDRIANVKDKQLSSLEVGVVGYGRLGRIMSSYLKNLAGNIIVWDLSRSARDLARSDGFEVTEGLSDLLARADVVTLHVSTTRGEAPVLAENTIAQLKKGMTIINTSRGSIVDETAVASAVDSGTIAMYLTDVLEFEESGNNISESILWKKSLGDSRIVITPHIGGASLDAMRKCELRLLTRLLERISN